LIYKAFGELLFCVIPKLFHKADLSPQERS